MANVSKTPNDNLDKMLTEWVDQVMKDASATLIDKARVFDRALKWEAIKLKMTETDWGSGLFGGDDDDFGDAGAGTGKDDGEGDPGGRVRAGAKGAGVRRPGNGVRPGGVDDAGSH